MGTTWNPWTWCPPVLRRHGPGSQGWSTWWQGSVMRTACPNAKGPETNILPVLPGGFPSSAELGISSGFLISVFLFSVFALLQVSTGFKAVPIVFPVSRDRAAEKDCTGQNLEMSDCKIHRHIPQSHSLCKTIHLIWWCNTEIHSEVFLLCCQIGTEHMWHVEHSKFSYWTNMRRVRQ